MRGVAGLAPQVRCVRPEYVVPSRSRLNSRTSRNKPPDRDLLLATPS